MIALKNVTKRYGRVNALRAVSLTMEGKSVAVLGENGAGKTSLAGIFCGITAPSNGSATVDGLPLTSREAAERIGYMPEKCQLSPSLTLVESMSFAAELRGLDENAVGKALDEADMNNGLARVPVGMLGGAALKRASLAFALLGSPEYVVLDQPIQGLSEED